MSFDPKLLKANYMLGGKATFLSPFSQQNLSPEGLPNGGRRPMTPNEEIYEFMEDKKRMAYHERKRLNDSEDEYDYGEECDEVFLMRKR